MTYIINKTDGTVLTEITDGNVDQISTDLTLIGKSASDYGEYINENLVRLLENFANSTQPTKSIQGQLWFDTLENRLKVYDGKGYKVSGGTIVAPYLPSSITQGDIWINSSSRQLYFNDGVETVLAGPQLPSVTGFSVVTVYGTDQNPYVVIKIMIDTKLFAILSNDTFVIDTDLTDNGIDQWPAGQVVNQGLNLLSIENLSGDLVQPLVSNIRTSYGDYDAVNNVRLKTAIKQNSPYAITLDISSLHDATTDTIRDEKIGNMLDKIFPVVDYDVGVFNEVIPKCNVLCIDGNIKTIRTFNLTSSTTDEDIKWRNLSDVIDVSDILSV